VNERTLVEAVKKALEIEIESIVAEEAKEAARKVETRVREKTAQVACRILNQINFESRGPELVIRVNFNEAPR